MKIKFIQLDMLYNPEIKNSKAFLGIKSSCTNRLWLGLTPDQDKRSLHLKQLCNIDDIIARSLSRMNLQPDEVTTFLNPRLKNVMFDPSLLLDLDKAAHRIFKGIIAGDKFAVISNGRMGSICSLANLIKWFSHYSKGINHLGIEKENEGFFPSRKHFEELAKNNDIIICLGCGTNIEFDADWVIGTDIIIVDDMVSVENLPKVYALINSNRFDENPDFSYLGTSGLFFLLMVATNRLFRKNNRQTVDLYHFLDVVALGTVSDHLPMVKLNRALVRSGLEGFQKRENIALREIVDTLSLGKPITSSQLALQLGERICAGEVIKHGHMGVNLLTTANRGRASVIAEQLNELYQTSNDLVSEYFEKFYALILERDTEAPLVWAFHQACPLSVMEKIVPKINQRTNRPTILMTYVGAKVFAIGQSVPGVNLGIIIANSLNDGIVNVGGGNSMRVMLELFPQNINRFIDRVTTELYYQRESWNETFPVYIDGLLSLKGVNITLIKKLSQLEPFGISSPKPRYGFANQVIRSRINLGNGQYKLVLEDESGTRIEGFLPNTNSSPLEKFLLGSRKKKIHVAGTISSFVRSGKTIPTILVEDAAIPI